MSQTQVAFRWEVRGDIFRSGVVEIRADNAVAQGVAKPDVLVLVLREVVARLLAAQATENTGFTCVVVGMLNGMAHLR